MNQQSSHQTLSEGMILLFAFSCGLIVSNLYYAQPLISLIAPEIKLTEAIASFIVTLTQIGYCAGLVLLVPLGDLIENKKLILFTIVSSIIAMISAMQSHTANTFLISSLAIGITTVAVQMLIPLAAHLSPVEKRGQTVGTIMGGLLAGIMLSRPFSSLLSHAFGWRAVFGIAATLLIILAIALFIKLPNRKPNAEHNYFSLIASLWPLLRDTPILRRRAIYQGSLFASFSLFWTIAPILLLSPLYNFTQKEVALFALAGALGVFAAPIGGRLADKGYTTIATGVALSLGALAFLISYFGGKGSLTALVLSGIILDIGVQLNVVLGQRAIYTLAPEFRSRFNALYMSIFFLGGSLGSAIASYAYLTGSWNLIAIIGFAFPASAFVYYLKE